MNKTLVLGIGNEILSDDGIGLKLTCDLRSLISLPDVDFGEACCGGLEILDLIKGYRRVIFIDSILTGKGEPGTVYYFTPGDFRETSHLSSLHDVSFLTALRLGKNLDIDMPEDIHIIAVEIIENMEFGEEFTTAIRAIYPRILDKVSYTVNRILL